MYYIRRSQYEDEDDKLNIDNTPLSNLVEIVTISLRQIFGFRSPGNYRWVGGDDTPEGDPNLSEIFITESEHRLPELMDRLPTISISLGQSQHAGLNASPGNVPNPVTGIISHFDLVPTMLYFRACSTSGTEALRLAELAKVYFVIFKGFFTRRAGLHDVAGNITISRPIASAQIEGGPGRMWTEVVVSVPIQVNFGIHVDYSVPSAFRRIRKHVIMAIEESLNGVFVLDTADAGE